MLSKSRRPLSHSEEALSLRNPVTEAQAKIIQMQGMRIDVLGEKLEELRAERAVEKGGEQQRDWIPRNRQCKYFGNLASPALLRVDGVWAQCTSLVDEGRRPGFLTMTVHTAPVHVEIETIRITATGDERLLFEGRGRQLLWRLSAQASTLSFSAHHAVGFLGFGEKTSLRFRLPKSAVRSACPIKVSMRYRINLIERPLAEALRPTLQRSRYISWRYPHLRLAQYFGG